VTRKTDGARSRCSAARRWCSGRRGNRASAGPSCTLRAARRRRVPARLRSCGDGPCGPCLRPPPQSIAATSDALPPAAVVLTLTTRSTTSRAMDSRAGRPRARSRAGARPRARRACGWLPRRCRDRRRARRRCRTAPPSRRWPRARRPATGPSRTRTRRSARTRIRRRRARRSRGCPSAARPRPALARPPRRGRRRRWPTAARAARCATCWSRPWPGQFDRVIARLTRGSGQLGRAACAAGPGRHDPRHVARIARQSRHVTAGRRPWDRCRTGLRRRTAARRRPRRSRCGSRRRCPRACARRSGAPWRRCGCARRA